MTRREFSVVVAGFSTGARLFSAGPRFYRVTCSTAGDSAGVLLRAVAGARLPETLGIIPISGFEHGALAAIYPTFSPAYLAERLWELRTYTDTSGSATLFADVFRRAGIRPVLRGIAGSDLTYLIAFEDFAARERGWATLNADRLWMKARPQFRSYRFGLYRAAT